MAESLHHPCHPHALNLRELSRDCDVRCFLCSLDPSGSAYCCLDCDIFLHESCADLPLQLQHPSHPKHSLNLSRVHHGTAFRCKGCDNYYSEDSFFYSCDECKFGLDITCAASTLPAPRINLEEKTIEHFSHDHPLARFHMDETSQIMCRACDLSISGSTYGCRRCLFMLHESCAQLSREIPRHPLHNNQHALKLLAHSVVDLLCEACEHYYQFTYQCAECWFQISVRCAISTLPLQDQQREDALTIQHISHSHDLKYFSMATDSDIRCKACDRDISGEVYGCTDCIFFLHKPCAELPQEMVLPLHPHPLYLEKKFGLSGKDIKCWCCGEQSSRFFYSCPSCPFNLDIGCSQKILAALEERVRVEIHHPFHQHPLVLHNFIGQRTVLCNACEHPIQGLGYVSEDGIEAEDSTLESYREYSPLHISCAGLPRELEHPCHPKHPLKLTASDESFNCDACHRESSGYAFSCDECNFHLAADCASRKPSLKHQLHEHSLIYFPRTQYLRCNRCGDKCDTDLYRCVQCNFNLHHGCVPIPLSAQHELHIHPLLLRDRVVDESYDEHYCDLCETLRNPDHGVYYCEDCNYAAHIHCVIPIVDPEGTIEVQKAMLDKLDEEIASLVADMKEMKIKLDALTRKRADIISSSLICCYENGTKRQIGNKEEIRTHRYTWKTFDRKTYRQRRRKSIIVDDWYIRG